MKDIEKSIVGNLEAYTAFKIKLEALPQKVVVIASHTHADVEKEKVCLSCVIFSLPTYKNMFI